MSFSAIAVQTTVTRFNEPQQVIPFLTQFVARPDAHRSPAASLAKAPAQTAIGRHNAIHVFESALGPVAYVGSFWLIAYLLEGRLRPSYLLLTVLIFALTFPSRDRLQSSMTDLLIDITLGWITVVALLVATGIATGYLREFSSTVIVTWFWAVPVAELVAVLALRSAAPFLLRLQGPKQRAIIVGMNEQGIALADRINAAVLSRIEVVGFVDGRSSERLKATSAHPLLESMDRLAYLVKTRNIHLIYLSLPMASQPRILQLLDQLKDTTASIYFVPDMFFTDLIQARTDSVVGMPVISVCETPFKGPNGVVKRLSDLVMASVILCGIFPVLMVIAAFVKLTSPGPVIFKQRRYGLDGEEILIYKFRSMKITEDGGTVKQAVRDDARVTPLGRFLRKTSLDELPQFINVLQGRMSIVGPRPHAVVHNEMYRKLIKGYMVRHKVKPGITGWAQVNGLRGETKTLDKMQHRIEFDLDYLRNWSLRLDLHIIARTIRLVIQDQKAY